MDVLSRDLQVMDASAISLARENRIPIIVFDIHKPGAFAATMRGRGNLHHHQRTRAEEMTADLKELEKRMQGAMDALKKELGGLGPAAPRSTCSTRSWSTPTASACR